MRVTKISGVSVPFYMVPNPGIPYAKPVNRRHILSKGGNMLITYSN